MRSIAQAATPDDLEAAVALVRAAGLPAAGMPDAFPAGYVVARSGSELVGVAGLEVHGRFGLLRSVAVRPSHRSAGLGRLLVEDRLRTAAGLGLREVYLLTTTAADFFRRLGFTDAPRADAPPELQRSSEFASICPETAVCLARRLE
jgi:N-acetylglutamate synthase-like GNAT family acetyltransferase